MGRPVVLSNGQLFVGLDENGLVHDFYYPYVGLENLTTARSSQHKIGVWVDNRFSWTDDGSWEIKVDFEIDALISHVEFKSNDMQITLLFKDYIDTNNNSFIRHVNILNNSETDREVRLFMHQVFQISRSGRADTALYVPEEHYILDYKGKFCLLISGQFQNNDMFDEYAVGNYQIEGKEGTFLDAEDGELSNNPVEHGGVDSVIRFSKLIKANHSVDLDYWIIAASSQTDAEKVHRDYKNISMDENIKKVRLNWQTWVNKSTRQYSEKYTREIQHSLLIIKAHCDDRGSILASGDSSIFNYGRDYYCYCWPRDAAYAIWPLIRMGHFTEAKQFFEFARDTKHPDGYLMHKYQPDRAIGSTWHPLIHGRNKELAIQQDETAGVIFMIGEYLEANPSDRNYIEHLFQSFIVPCANWICSFVDEQTGLPHASYDLWEEKFITSTYTTSITIASLESAAKLANEFNSPVENNKWSKIAGNMREKFDLLYNPDGYFRKGFLLKDDNEIIFDDTIDISNLYGPFMYLNLPMDDIRLISTAKFVEDRLTNISSSGGIIRYEYDNYFLTKKEFKGNPWGVTTLWLAQYFVSAGEIDKAKSLLKWVIDRQNDSGTLSEQYDPENLAPLSVHPLVWSHAELINTILDLDKYN